MARKVLLNQVETEKLIPQKHPMVMVDGLIDHDDLKTRSRLGLFKENIFCNDGYFSEPGLIENMAQTAALRAGYIAKLAGNKPATGFIGAVKKFRLYNLPKDNEVLHTEISVEAELLNALIIKGKVFVDQTLVAEAELSIFTQQ